MIYGTALTSSELLRTIKPFEALHLLFESNDYVASPNVPALLNHVEPTELFCINPLDGCQDYEPTKKYHAPNKPRRADINVTAFRNFIFESDSAPLDKQIESIKKLDGLVRLAVYSGNKSIALIVSVADALPFKPHSESGISDYKMAWTGLCNYLESITGLKYDKSTKNPSRLTRTPNVQRSDTQKLQELLYIGNYVTSEFVLSKMLSSTAHKQNNVYTIKPDINSYKDFERLLATEFVYRGLRNKLQESYKWAQPQNMYPEILKLSLWAIDSTGVSLEVLREYMHTHTFPALLAVGYPAFKIEEGLVNAYRYKGLL